MLARGPLPPERRRPAGAGIRPSPPARDANASVPAASASVRPPIGNRPGSPRRAGSRIPASQGTGPGRGRCACRPESFRSLLRRVCQPNSCVNCGNAADVIAMVPSRSRRLAASSGSSWLLHQLADDAAEDLQRPLAPGIRALPAKDPEAAGRPPRQLREQTRLAAARSAFDHKAPPGRRLGEDCSSCSISRRPRRTPLPSGCPPIRRADRQPRSGPPAPALEHGRQVGNHGFGRLVPITRILPQQPLHHTSRTPGSPGRTARSGTGAVICSKSWAAVSP